MLWITVVHNSTLKYKISILLPACLTYQFHLLLNCKIQLFQILTFSLLSVLNYALKILKVLLRFLLVLSVII
jgi:hypothetical protein